jgi:hypothetical protein
VTHDARPNSFQHSGDKYNASTESARPSACRASPARTTVTWTTRNDWLTPIPATPLDATPPTFRNTCGSRGDAGGAMPVPVPPMTSKTKSSSSTKSRKRKEARALVPFPSSSQAEGSDDRPRRIPQMSTAHGWDGVCRAGVSRRHCAGTSKTEAETGTGTGAGRRRLLTRTPSSQIGSRKVLFDFFSLFFSLCAPRLYSNSSVWANFQPPYIISLQPFLSSLLLSTTASFVSFISPYRQLFSSSSRSTRGIPLYTQKVYLYAYSERVVWTWT